MKIYIRCDMEGATGITKYEQVTPGTEDYSFGQKMLMNDLNAAIAGAFDGGADEVLVYDMHADGRNVLVDELDSRASLIIGKPLPTDGFACGLDNSFEAMFLVGFHSRAETQDALLAHSYELETADIVINGKSVGEIGVEAGIAGEMGVPLALLTGDSEAIREGKDLIGEGLHSVSVKQSLGSFAACCFSPAQTEELIRSTAASAAKELRSSPGLSFGTPVSVNIRFNQAETAGKLSSSDGITLLDDLTISLGGDTLLETWRRYLHFRGAQSSADS